VIKAVIFDCFGVLAGTGIWSVYERAGGDIVRDAAFLDEVFDKSNLALITREEARERVAKKLGISVDQWRKLVDEDEVPNVEVFEYIRSALKPKYKIGLLSNASPGMPKRHFTDEQIKLLDAVIVSGEVGLIKPDPKIFQLAVEKLGVEPEEALFTDDHAKYLGGAREIGMQAHQFTSVAELKITIEELEEG
jgi:HAD superfamily hydrolase (TIGR01509 family)